VSLWSRRVDDDDVVVTIFGAGLLLPCVSSLDDTNDDTDDTDDDDDDDTSYEKDNDAA
jgi:hypothetical protein